MKVPALKDIVELESYNYLILNPNGKSFECITDTFTCKAAKYMQCAQNQTTAADYRWWDFQVCFQNERSRIPRNADECAKKAGLDSAVLSKCANDDTQNFNLLLEDVHKCNSMTPRVTGPDQMYINGNLQRDTPKGLPATYYADLVCKAYTSNGGTAPAACGNTTHAA